MRFPLLEALLCQRGMSLKGVYRNRDVADLFGVSIRTIQDWSRNGDLRPRNLPGRARFLSVDLEQFLQNSAHPPTPADDDNFHYIAPKHRIRDRRV